MNPDVAGGLVLIAVGVGCLAGVWLGVTYAHTTHLCFACRGQAVEQCGDICTRCETDQMPGDVAARIKEAVDREWYERWSELCHHEFVRFRQLKGDDYSKCVLCGVRA